MISVKLQEVETSPYEGDSYQAIVKMKDVFRIYATESDFDVMKQRIDNAKKLASAKLARNITDNAELFSYLLDLIESQGEDGLSIAERNLIEINHLINEQIEKNLHDDVQGVFANGDKAFINKVFITKSWVQDKAKCSLKPVNLWFGNPDNQALLDKHHALIKEKFGIAETHNRRIKMLVKKSN